jgi:GTPase
VTIRRQLEFDDFLEVRVAVLGNVDAGKSTLLGVLTHGLLDDGRGSARQHLLRHLHEQQTGRTSSVGCNILGFDSNGRSVNESCVHGSRLQWTEVCVRSTKVLSLLDLAGHERYLKTTIFGLTGLQPHCALLMVGGNAGLIGMGREHLGLCLALSLPVFVVVSKVDSAPSNVLQQTLVTLQRLLRSSSCRRTPLLVRDSNDVWMAAEAIAHRRPLCPVFQLSSVTGHNMNLIRQFLSLLSPLNTSVTAPELTHPTVVNPVEFHIEETFSVPGVGTVVSGLCLTGNITPNDTLLLGPDRTGKFNPVHIKSIHRKRLPVLEVKGGHSAALALKKVHFLSAFFQQTKANLFNFNFRLKSPT